MQRWVLALGLFFAHSLYALEGGLGGGVIVPSGSLKELYSTSPIYGVSLGHNFYNKGKRTFYMGGFAAMTKFTGEDEESTANLDLTLLAFEAKGTYKLRKRFFLWASLGMASYLWDTTITNHVTVEENKANGIDRGFFAKTGFEIAFPKYISVRPSVSWHTVTGSLANSFYVGEITVVFRGKR
jgi:hypothetical protein